MLLMGRKGLNPTKKKILRPSLWSIHLVIGPLNRFLYQSGPWTQFAVWRFFSVEAGIYEYTSLNRSTSPSAIVDIKLFWSGTETRRHSTMLRLIIRKIWTRKVNNFRFCANLAFTFHDWVKYWNTRKIAHHSSRVPIEGNALFFFCFFFGKLHG